jgi:hypothetical protein
MSPATLPADDALFAVGGDRLWNAYRQYALDRGNELQLLIGQDGRWLDEAARWKKKEPEKERAFLTVVMLEGGGAETRQLAYRYYLESIRILSEPMQLLRKLFIDTRTFPETAGIPDQVRYLLVDDALSKNDMALATRLMSGFEAVPAGADPFEWGLRRARILVLGGHHVEGVAGLHKLLDTAKKLDRSSWDRVLQVLFDLQTVGPPEPRGADGRAARDPEGSFHAGRPLPGGLHTGPRVRARLETSGLRGAALEPVRGIAPGRADPCVCSAR